MLNSSGGASSRSTSARARAMITPTASRPSAHSSASPTFIPPEKWEYWREMRQIIMHEDNLVNHRFTWLLTFEGFLMGGFFLVQNGLFSNKVSMSVIASAEAFLCVIMLLSMWICYVAGRVISTAYHHSAIVYGKWKSVYADEWWDEEKLPPWFLPISGDVGVVSTEEIKHPQNHHSLASENFEVAKEAERKVPQFPPLMGKFRYCRFGEAQRIPFALLLINAIAAIGCIFIIAFSRYHPDSFYAPSSARQAIYAPYNSQQMIVTSHSAPTKR